jgi:phosphatidylinositol kinase/protein kinase (PI-3  family)
MDDGAAPERHSKRARIPAVSVIIAAHDAAEFLKECLDSVARQTFMDSVEVSVFLDGSQGADACEAICTAWEAEQAAAAPLGRFSLVLSKGSDPALGAGPARNRAIQQSSGEFLCILDADDVMMPERLEYQVRACKEHPHALVYPLTVAAKSVNANRKRAAAQILEELRHSAKEGIAALVDQAQLVSHELIRVAILWHEEWFETMDDASRMHFNEKNLQGMIELLEPLHEKLNRQYETIHEQEFTRKYGRDLDEAARFVGRYKESGQDADISQAWELYYLVFRKIFKVLQQEKVLQLNQVSPALLNASHMQLAVPGTYVANTPIVRIEGFAPTIRMIVSKQRPRQITVYGSDGKDYLFLLKGHEDLRQDERVMQLFGLVNRLLKKERETNRYDLTIERYSVIPLSHNVGISEWLANTDTFHALIEKFRS